VRVEEHTITIEHVPVFYREGVTDAAGEPPAPGVARPAPSAPGPPALYLHEALTSSADWLPFLERTGGIAPDLIGFGRSGKGGHLDYSPAGLTTFVERFLGELELERVKLVGHGWGAAIALLLAARDPRRIERLVLIDAVPLLGGVRWPRLVEMMRKPLLGELLMGSITRTMLARHLRRGAVRPGAWSDAELRAVWDQFDQGTQRALLRLHRRVDETRLAELGSELESLELPVLILWGERDSWFAPELAERYADRLPRASVSRVAEAGHWPWRDDPAAIEIVAEFLAKAEP
jgi:pimeloyl-ACP methyl ester carboxylesterase